MTKQETITADAALTGILPAIAAAMGDIHKLGKGERNKHDGYNFASIDDFLALVNPICARHGLIIFSDEIAREDFAKKGRNGETAWMRATFSFVVHHVSGQCLPEMRRTVEVMRNGAQAYGSAQSYCLKQFLRGLFLIPTGDKDDADFERTDAGTVVRQEAPKFDPRACADRIISALNRAATPDELAEKWRDNAEAIADVKTANAAIFAEINGAKDTRKEALTPVPSADLGDDSIPY